MKERWRVRWVITVIYERFSSPPERLQVVILIHSQSPGSLHLELVYIKYCQPFIRPSRVVCISKAYFSIVNSKVFT